MKLFGDFFGTEDNLGAKEAREGRPVGPTTNQGAPEAPGLPLWVVGPMRTALTYVCLYKYSKIPKT